MQQCCKNKFVFVLRNTVFLIHQNANTMKQTDNWYRIITAEFTVKYAGTGNNSWFTLDDAKKLADADNGDMIYKYCPQTNERLWEVL